MNPIGKWLALGVMVLGAITASVLVWTAKVAAARERERVGVLLDERRAILRALDLYLPPGARAASNSDFHRVWTGPPFLSGKGVIAAPDAMDSVAQTELPEALRARSASETDSVIFIDFDVDHLTFRVTIVDVRSGWVSRLPGTCANLQEAMHKILALPRVVPFALGDLHGYIDIKDLPSGEDPSLLSSARILPVDVSSGHLDSIWSLLPEARRATRAEEVELVARLEWSEDTVGLYNGVSPALQHVCHVTIIDWKSHRILVEKEIRGSMPPQRIDQLQPRSGTLPREEVARFIQAGL